MSGADRFDAYLLALDDQSFFALVRNYLGAVRTPYQKHDLIARLAELLRRDETVERIVTLLDYRDRVVLTAIRVLGYPPIDRLSRFLTGELEPAEVRLVVANLRDRLLVIDTDRNDGLEVNPLLLGALDTRALDPGLLVRGRPREEAETDAQPWLTPPLMVALRAFLRDENELFSRTGEIRKRASRRLEGVFGDLFVGEPGEQRLRVALSALETLALVHRRDGAVVPLSSSWQELYALPPHWISALIVAATLTTTLERAFDYASLLFELVRAVPSERCYTAGEMVRLMQLQLVDRALPVDTSTVEGLALAGVLTELETGPAYALNRAAIPLLSDDDREESANSIAFHGTMEVTVAPHADPRAALTVAELGEIRSFDLVAQFELTEASIAAGSRVSDMAPAERLASIAPVPQNVTFHLTRWRQRAASLRVVTGTVVIAAEEEAEILRRAEEFMRLVREEPISGIFVLRRDRVQDAGRVLNRLGLGGAVTEERADEPMPAPPDYERLRSRAVQPALRPPGGVPAQQAAVDDPRRSDPEAAPSGHVGPRAVVEELHATLDAMDLHEDVSRELALRIDRKLILFADQLRSEAIPNQVTEARLLDYVGKVRIIEQALASGDHLEVIVRSGTGQPQRVLVRPRELTEGGSDLVLRAVNAADGRALKIRVRRITLVRRLSGTLIRRGAR